MEKETGRFELIETHSRARKAKKSKRTYNASLEDDDSGVRGVCGIEAELVASEVDELRDSAIDPFREEMRNLPTARSC